MRKMLCLIFAICFSFFLLATGNTAAEFVIKGYDWQKRSVIEKMSFVEGWALCGKAAADNLIVNVNRWNDSSKEVDFQIEVLKDEGVVLSGVTIRQIVDGVDKIYSDYRVTTRDITEVMPLVSGRLIQGWTEKELDEAIAFLIRLDQCEEREKKQGSSIAECSSLRKERNAFLKKLKKK